MALTRRRTESRESIGARRIRRIVITVNHSLKYFSNSGSFESYRQKHKPEKTFDGYCISYTKE
jgi:hypothetical protein